jgi:hypothetical protein
MKKIKQFDSIIITYWRGSILSGLPYSQHQFLPWSSETQVSITNKILSLGYQVMLMTHDQKQLILCIDNYVFKQKYKE